MLHRWLGRSSDDAESEQSMIAICKMLPRADVTELGFGAGSDVYLTDQHQYNLSAISIMRGSPWVLILPDRGRPDWYPAPLFRMMRDEVPSHWRFRIRPDDSVRTSVIWGYAEVALSDDHLFGLAEREPEALELFYRRNEFEQSVDELQWQLLGLSAGSISALQASSWAISALEGDVGSALASDAAKCEALAELASFDEGPASGHAEHIEAFLALTR